MINTKGLAMLAMEHPIAFLGAVIIMGGFVLFSYPPKRGKEEIVEEKSVDEHCI